MASIFTRHQSKSNQISLLSHIMHTSVPMVKFFGTKLCAMAVKATRYEQFTIYKQQYAHFTHYTHLHNIQ